MLPFILHSMWISQEKNTSPALGACCLDQKRVSLAQCFEWSLWISLGLCARYIIRWGQVNLFILSSGIWLVLKVELRKKTGITPQHTASFREILSRKITFGKQNPGTDSPKMLSGVLPLGKSLWLSLKTIWFILFAPFDLHNCSVSSVHKTVIHMTLI